MFTHGFHRPASVILLALATAWPAPATPAALAQDVGPAEIAITEGLVIPRVGRGGRRPVHEDAIEALIVRDEFTPPNEGDTVEVSHKDYIVKRIQGTLEMLKDRTIPDWLELDRSSLKGKVVRLPIKADAGLLVEESQIVELCNCRQHLIH